MTGWDSLGLFDSEYPEKTPQWFTYSDASEIQENEKRC